MVEKTLEAVKFLKSKIDFKIDVALVLGSGLGDFADSIENPIVIKYNEIPNFPKSTVQGHKGQFVFGEVQGKKICVMQGRVHYYEGYAMHEVVFPQYVISQLGAKVLILTNAVGGISEKLNIGDFTLIEDHINLTGYNPLIGRHYVEFGERFPSLNNAYDKDLRAKAKQVASNLGLTLHDSIFIQLSGPSYETPAEIRAYKSLGADTCGMSTAIEAIAGVHSGLKVVAISFVSNKAAGLSDLAPSHTEVLENIRKSKVDFQRLLNGLIKEIDC